MPALSDSVNGLPSMRVPFITTVIVYSVPACSPGNSAAPRSSVLATIGSVAPLGSTSTSMSLTGLMF